MPGDIIAPRANTTQQVNSVRFGLNFANGAAIAGKMIGSIPVGSDIKDVTACVTIPFNAGTTNVLSLGTTKTNANELLQAGDITPGTASRYANARGLGMALTMAPTPAAAAGGDDPQGGVGIWAKAAFTGTPPTQGLVVFVVTFVPPNDN